jgi:hypothetical protein
MDREIEKLRDALRWCLDEGLDDYVHETELQRLTEYRALLQDPLPQRECVHAIGKK